MTTVTEALQKEVRSLCLNEYPFGSGSWQIDVKQPLACRMYSSTSENYGYQKDHIETLKELMTSQKSPWYSEAAWSDELSILQQIAITNPQKLTPSFIRKTFKTLRIIDKNVSEIDSRLLELENLEELSLSANYLTSINSEFLPPKLKVLELYANLISDLGSLIKNPPCLYHLGLGRNRLQDVSSHISVTYWPSLMSLDLSDNNLEDLFALIENLRSLPKLRNLLLSGNPISLMPSYRGFTIDCIPGLTSFDDIIITADEKHDFRGMCKRSEVLKNEARVSLKIPFVKGIPNPSELDEMEKSGNEFPVIERKYEVEFPFISNVEKRMVKPESAPEGTEKDAAKKAVGKGKTAKSPVQKTAEELEIERLEHERLVELERQRIAGPPEIVHFGTLMLEYDADQLSFEHDEQYRVASLLQLRDLFKSGIEFKIIEEKTLYYPVGQTPEEVNERTASGKRSKSRRASRVAAQLSEQERGSSSHKTSHGVSKQPPVPVRKSIAPGAMGDLVKYSTIRSCIASATLELVSLVASPNQTRVKSLLHAGGGPMRPEDLELAGTPPPTASDAKKEKKDKKDKKPKPGSKDKRKGAVGGEEEGDVQPPPILILVEVDVRRWTKTKQFVKEHDDWPQN